jgi:O-acetyl-ADP-ribose deacetylase (regulator of RNase III)
MKEVYGNLLTLSKKGEFNLIGHGCNTYTTMGAGIAGQIAKVYPKAVAADKAYWALMRKQFPETFHSMMLGTLSVAHYSNVSILNIYSQITPGPDFRIGGLIVACTTINKIYEGKKIGLPIIGAGIGGGTIENTLSVYEKHLKNIELTVVHYKP